MENQKPDKYEIIPHQHFRDLTREQKVQHILDYYLLHIIGAAALLILIVVVVVYFAFQYRRTQLYTMCVDISTEQAEVLKQEEETRAQVLRVFEELGYGIEL